MEANRDARRSVQGNKSAVAFEIDLGGNTAVSKAPVISRERVRQSLDNVSNNNNSPYSVQSDASSVVAAVAGSVKARSVREDKEGHPSATAAANSESTKSRAKKGWGPPVSSSDIAKGVVRHSEYSTPTSQMFAPDRDASGKGGNAGNASVSSSSVVDRDQYFDDDGSSMAEEGRQQVHHHRDFSRDSIDAMSVATEEDQLVLRRLESKRNSQIEARQQAKEVFKKLREQRRKESELKSRRPSAGSLNFHIPLTIIILNLALLLFLDAKVIVQHSVVSPVKKINPNDGAVRAADASPMQIRLMEVMSQVEIANDSVLKAVSGIGASTTESADESAFRVKNPSAGAASSASQQYRSRANSESTPTTSASQASTPSRKVGGGGAVSSSQQQQYAKDVQRLDGHIPLIAEEEEDDLEYTLDNWLTQQKRGVTQRKKHGHGGLLSADDGGNDDDAALIVVVDAGIIEDSADGYRTQKKYDRMYDSQAKGNSAFEEVQDENIDFYTSDTYVVDSKDHDVDQEETVTMSNGNVVRGKYMGNDVEVVGLQCMLAQALMGDNDED